MNFGSSRLTFYTCSQNHQQHRVNQEEYSKWMKITLRRLRTRYRRLRLKECFKGFLSITVHAKKTSVTKHPFVKQIIIKKDFVFLFSLLFIKNSFYAVNDNFTLYLHLSIQPWFLLPPLRLKYTQSMHIVIFKNKC